MIFSKKVLVLAIIFIVAALMVYYLIIKKGALFDGRESAESPTEQISEPTQTPLPVRVAKVVRGDLVVKLQSPGEAKTDRIAVIRSETSGKLNNLLVAEGQYVERGELLAELGNRQAILDLEKAEASRLKVLSEILLEKRFSEASLDSAKESNEELDRASKEYESILSQFRKGLISEEEWELAYREYEKVLIESGQKKDEIMAATKGLTQYEISVKAARMNLEKTRVKAPFSGIVTDIKVSEQQYLSEMTELFTLVDTTRVYVQAKVLESEIGKMHVGRKAYLEFSAYPDEVFQGRVKAVSPILDGGDKTCRVFISFNPAQREIKPGMYADVEFDADVLSNLLLVPQEAIVLYGGKKVVFLVKDGVARRVAVQTGMENEEYVEVVLTEDVNSNLAEGDFIVVEGHLTLAEETHVRIVE